MAALTFPDLTTSTDSDELKAYKAQVKEVAQRYGRQHNLCSVLNKALKEIGIEDEKKVSVQVTTKAPLAFSFSVKALPSALNGKTEDEQKAVLAGLIGDVSLAAGAGVTAAKFAVSPESVESMSLDASPAANLPEGREWRYTSDQGRVVHAFTTANSSRWGSYSSLCGIDQYYQPTTDSVRGEGRQCTRCAAAL